MEVNQIELSKVRLLYRLVGFQMYNKYVQAHNNYSKRCILCGKMYHISIDSGTTVCVDCIDAESRKGCKASTFKGNPNYRLCEKCTNRFKCFTER